MRGVLRERKADPSPNFARERLRRKDKLEPGASSSGEQIFLSRMSPLIILSCCGLPTRSDPSRSTRGKPRAMQSGGEPPHSKMGWV